MITRLFLLCLFAISSQAQTFTFNDVAFVGAASPKAGGPDWSAIDGLITNYAGYSLDARWTGDNYATNTTPVWSDSWTNGWSITNVESSASWPGSGTLNGHRTVLFDGSNDYLAAQRVTNTSPLCFCFVWKAITSLDNKDLFSRWWSDSSLTVGVRLSTGGTLYQRCTSSIDAALVPTAWRVDFFNFVGSANSSCVTNGVISKTNMSTGAAVLNGFCVGAQAKGQNSNVEIAEILLFGLAGPLAGTNATACSNMTWALKQKYGL